jgi:hypothetical protein
MPLEPRAVVHFWSPRQIPNEMIHSELEEIYGKDAITLRTIEKWTVAIERGRAGPADLPRSGRWRDTGRLDAVRALIRGQGYLSWENTAQTLDIHHETAKCILRDGLHMGKVNIMWLPQARDSSEKTAWVELSRQLIDFRESRVDRSLPNVYTEDQTWVHLDNPQTFIWIGVDIVRPARVRRTIACKKRIFW